MLRLIDLRGLREEEASSRGEDSSLTRSGVAWSVAKLGSKVGEENSCLLCMTDEVWELGELSVEGK